MHQEYWIRIRNAEAKAITQNMKRQTEAGQIERRHLPISLCTWILTKTQNKMIGIQKREKIGSAQFHVTQFHFSKLQK